MVSYNIFMDGLRVRFGNRLRKLRKEAGFTQEELSEQAEISVDFVGMIERGIRSPSPETLEKLALALNVEIADLYNFDE